MREAVRLRSSRVATAVREGPGVGAQVVLLLVVVCPLTLALLLDGTDYDTWGGIVWIPVIMALMLPLCRWVARRTGEPHLAGWFFAAAALKIVVGAMTRRWVVEQVYGEGDAYGYDRAASELVEQIRLGDFSNLGKITGTRFIEVFTGVVQAFIGETLLGTYVVYAALGFVGLCFFYVAFREALPTGDARLYRLLLFLTPTLWFWPSGIGKEAFLTLCLGAIAFGFARLLAGGLAGAVPLALGMWGAAVVRPHLGLMALVGMVAALPTSVRSTNDGTADGRRRVAAQWAFPLLVLLLLPVAMSAAETFFHIEGLNVESATEVREEVVRRTAGSEGDFAAPNTNTPVGMVVGFATVVARPLLVEAEGFQVLTALESTILIVVMGVALVRRGKGTVRAFLQRWPRFALGYVLAFAWGFSAVSVFGILARQRSLMLPFLFVIVASTTRPSKAEVTPSSELIPA